MRVKLKVLLNRKNILLTSVLMAASTVASAAYYERVGVEVLDTNRSPLYSPVQYTNSTPIGNHVVTDSYHDSLYFPSATFNTTFSSSPQPFVRSEVFHELRNGGLGTSSASGSIAYDFYVSGTPNTQVPVSIASAFSFTGYSYNGSDAIYPIESGFLNGGFSSVSLSYGAGLLPSGGVTVGVDTDSRITVQAQYNGIDSPITSSADNVNPSTFSVTSDLVLNHGTLEIVPGRIFGGGTYSSNGLIIATLMLMLDENGAASAHVSIGATNEVRIPFDDGGVAYATAYIDPYISIASSYLRENPNALITLDTNVGNAPIATATVPVPAAAWLFGTAMLGLFGLNRRRSV